jgi:hypothetical protein
MITGYYYLHTNGELIYKPNSDDGVVADMRESDFVRMLWPMDTDTREDAWRILIEALALGANKERVTTLAHKWNCNDEDADNMAAHFGLVFSRDGDLWCAHRPGFANLKTSPAGFGVTKLEAAAELCKALGYTASKMGWGSTFQQLLKA